MNTLTTYTISVFAENKIGLLGRLTSIFVRRHINIESLTVSETGNQGVSRFTIVLHATKDTSDKLVSQIKKIVEVLTAFVHEDASLVHSEIAMYKISNDNNRLAEIIVMANKHKAKILHGTSSYLVLEKSGSSEELLEFLTVLQPLGVLEFVRSGRVALFKGLKESSDFHS